MTGAWIVGGRLRKRLAYPIVLLGSLWTAVPLYWMLVTALKGWKEVQARPPTMYPQAIDLAGFSEAFRYGSQGIKDSAIIVAGTLFVSLFLGVPAAYGLSRYHIGGPNLAFGILMFRFLPPVALVAAVFQITVQLIPYGVFLRDTYLLLILMNTLFNLPFVIWLMKGFFDEIPHSIEEAARMDGAGWLRTIADHILPIARPGLVAVSLFVGVFTWNELLFATILTGANVNPFTRVVPGLQIGKKYLQEPNWPAAMALGVLVVIAVVILGGYLQKHIVRAMTYGAVND